MLDQKPISNQETQEVMAKVIMEIPASSAQSIYVKFDQTCQKLRGDIQRLVRELQEAKWELKQTVAKLEKSERLARQLQTDNMSFRERLGRSTIERVFYQMPPEKVREIHLKDATITRLQAEIADYQQRLDSNQHAKDLQQRLDSLDKLYNDAKTDYREALQAKGSLERQVRELGATVNQLRAEKSSLKSISLGKLLEIWEDYDYSDE